MRSKEREEVMKKNTTRVILNVPKEIDEVYKELSIKRGISKSSMILYAMSWFLDYNKSMDMMPKLINLVSKQDDNSSD